MSLRRRLDIKSHIVVNALKMFFAGGLIYWLLERGSLDFSILLHLTDPLILALLLMLYLALMLSNNLRWHLFLDGLGIKIPFKETFKLSLMGLFFNFTMPGSVGGDFVKGYYLIKKQKGGKMKMAISIFLDRFSGFYTMTLTSLVALFFYIVIDVQHPYLAQLKSLWVFVLVLYILLSVVLIMCFSQKFYKTFQKFLIKYVWNLFNIKKGRDVKFLPFSYFLKAMALSLLTLAFCVIFFEASAILMGFDIPFWIYLYAVPLGFVCMSVPISPGGIGVGQVATLALFSYGLGRDTQVGPATMSAFHIIGILWGLVGAVIYLQIKQDKAKTI